MANRTPISVVEPGWLEAEFLPAVARAVWARPAANIVWLLTDANGEAEYLLEHCRVHFVTARQPWCEVLVDAADPLTIWQNLIGTQDDRSPATECVPNTVFAVRGGCWCPASFLRNRGKELSLIFGGLGGTALFPVFHDTYAELERERAADALVVVPPFPAAAMERRRAVALALVEEAFPNGMPEERERAARELLGAGPASRSELQRWIDYYAASGPDGLQAVAKGAPRIPRDPRIAPDVRTKAELSALLRGGMVALRSASERFRAWAGAPLLEPIVEPPDPFQSSDPRSWFIGCVSFLACYLFDAADARLEPLWRYYVDTAAGDVRVGPVPPFYDALRVLRTVQQHGLRPSVNRKTLDAASAWFRAHSGVGSPGAGHWRGLTARLLLEWNEAAERLRAVVATLAESPMRDAVEAVLDLQSRRMPKQFWREQVMAAASEFRADVDVERVLDKHLDAFRRSAQDTALTGPALEQFLRDQAIRAVAEESARCPVTIADLQAVGIPPGPLLGLARKYTEAEWQRNPHQSKHDLLAAAQGRFAVPGDDFQKK